MAKNILKHWWFLQDNSVDSEKQLQMEEQKKKKKDEEKQEEKEEKVGKEEEETQNDTSEPQVDGLNGVYPWDQDLIVAHTYLMNIYN